MKKYPPISIILICLIITTVVGCTDTPGTGDDEVDVDLASMSTTMAQAEFNNIISNSADYMGKTIRVRGPYYSMYWDQT